MKNKLLEIWQSRNFQIFMDICRIVLIALAIIILITFIKEIEAVKLLAYDPCAICMEKTGWNCFCLRP